MDLTSGSTVVGVGVGWCFLQAGKLICTLKKQDSQVKSISGITVLTGW